MFSVRASGVVILFYEVIQLELSTFHCVMCSILKHLNISNENRNFSRNNYPSKSMEHILRGENIFFGFAQLKDVLKV